MVSISKQTLHQLHSSGIDNTTDSSFLSSILRDTIFIESLTDAVLLIDAENGDIRDANNAACMLTGRFRDALRGCCIASLHAPEDIAACLDFFAIYKNAAQAQAACRPHPATLLRPDGARQVCRVTVFARACPDADVLCALYQPAPGAAFMECARQDHGTSTAKVPPPIEEGLRSWPQSTGGEFLTDITARKGAETASRVSEKRLRLLIAEDSVSSRELIRLFLENEPYEIVMAETGCEALALFTPGAFDLILMDMEMPEMNGCAAAEAIRHLEAASGTRRTPILMLSAHAFADYEQKGLAAGCDGFMTKPIRKSRLIEALRRAVGP